MINVTEDAVQHQRQDAAALEWEVVDLVLNDDRVVRELFEEIVAAEWPPCPVAPVQDPPDGDDETASVDKPGREARLARSVLIRWATHNAALQGWARERSPPRGVRSGA